MTLTQNITLDVARETALHIAGKQFDENSRFLLVTIKEAGEEKSIPAGSTITLNARRPDGSAQSFAGSIQDGKAFVEIDQWILEQYGTVYCSISIVDSVAAKLTTLSFRLLVERAEGSGFVLVYVAAANLPAGTYYITMAGVNYSFTTTQAVPAGGKIYFSSVGTTGKTTNNGATIEDLTLTAGSTGTELQGSDIVNFLTQMQANVAAIDAELDSKADKSAIEENLAAGTSLATIDKNSYTPHNTPYLHRISPSGKRCEYDVIGGTVGWNQLVNQATLPSTATVNGVIFTNNGDGSITANGTATDAISRQLVGAMTMVSGYKYYFSGCPSGGSTTTYSISTSGYSDTGSGCIIANTATTRYFWISIANGTTVNNLVFRPNIIDLTTLLGSTIADYAYSLEQATAGSGIAWLKSFGFLTKSYYPYSEPTLESVQATARVARGINQWDEEWESGAFDANGSEITGTNRIRSKNYTPTIQGATYFFHIARTVQSLRISQVLWYDSNKAFLERTSLASNDATATVPSSASYFRFQTSTVYGNVYLNDICINISNPTINGTYYPYDGHSYPLGNVTLRGVLKLDSSNNIYYDGDKYKASGEITRRYGVVDLGTLTWTYDSDRKYFSSTGIQSLAKIPSSTTNPANVRCGIFLPVGATYIYNSATSFDKSVGILGTGAVCISDQSYSTAAAFKTAMSGVSLYYELATPTTETTDPFAPIQYTGSTEEFTTSNDVPVGVEGKYYTDLTLPKLPTANGTYTLKCTVTDGTGIVSWVSE